MIKDIACIAALAAHAIAETALEVLQAPTLAEYRRRVDQLADADAALAEMRRERDEWASDADRIREERDYVRVELDAIRVELEPQRGETTLEAAGRVATERSALREKLAACERERDALRAEQTIERLALCDARAVLDRVRRALPKKYADIGHGDAVERVMEERDEAREKLADGAHKLVKALFLYPNHNVQSRGPYGLILDALALLHPDAHHDLTEDKAPGYVLEEYFEDEEAAAEEHATEDPSS